MGESGRLPERFAAAFLFCPQRRISGAFRTPHRGLRFVIALANTTSISCGRFRAQLRTATSDSAPYIRLCGQTFFLFFVMPFADTASIDLRARHDEYSKALARTLASFRPLRTTFFFYTLFFLRCAVSRCDFRLCARYSSLRTDFFSFLCFALYRYGKYRSARSA